MGRIEWAMWANEQAVISSFFLLVGAIIGVAGMFTYWQFAAACIPASVLVLLIEWPRGKRAKGSTEQRRFHGVPSSFVDHLGPITKNYYVRFVILILAGVPGCFLLPTLLGAICLLLSSIIYFVAAVKGESWKPVEVRRPEHRAACQIPSIPQRPPPRKGGTANVAYDADISSVAVHSAERY